ncbi:MAG: ATP synthase F0 subunit C [Acidobacteriota bacterium]|nr:ATP synthase F0 subunit C [Acidobacteriota bacterium]
MRKFLTLMAMFMIGGLLFAQTGDAAAATGSWWSPTVGMALAAGLCGIAQGHSVAAACEGIARNPQAANNIRTTMIIGLALIESLALYTLIVALVKF